MYKETIENQGEMNMEKVNVTIDGIILHCDNSVASIDLGNGYKIEKKYFSDLPYKNKITDGEGKLTINYLGSQMKDEKGIYFMCLHKEANYEIQLPEVKSGIALTNVDLMCEQQLSEYKQKEMNYLHKMFSLLHLFKKGNIGFVQIFFVHRFTIFGFINQNIKQTDNSISKNIIEDTFTKARLAVNDRLTSLCPKSIGKFVSVYENMDSENPEDWANAVHSCRRILLDLADALYPPQKDPIIIGKKEILVGHDQYINRLVQFISSKKGSQTYFNVVGSDLRSIGERLDAINDAVCKGTHVNVSKDEASRYIIHTYLLVSDIISLMD